MQPRLQWAGTVGTAINFVFQQLLEIRSREHRIRRLHGRNQPVGDICNDEAYMKKCKGCGTAMNDEAKACPFCGRTQSAIRWKWIAVVSAVVAFGYMSLLIRGGMDAEKPSRADQRKAHPVATAKSATAAARVSDEECQQTLECWGRQASVYGAGRCAERIEKMAAHDVKWTDGWLEEKFTRYAWADQRSHTVRLIGDKVMFQNGFGAWTNMIYTCDFNPKTKQVVDVSVDEGHL